MLVTALNRPTYFWFLVPRPQPNSSPRTHLSPGVTRSISVLSVISCFHAIPSFVMTTHHELCRRLPYTLQACEKNSLSSATAKDAMRIADTPHLQSPSVTIQSASPTSSRWHLWLVTFCFVSSLRLGHCHRETENRH